MVRNSVAQYEAETGMTMSEEEIVKLRAKLDKAFPGLAPPPPPPPPPPQ